jgi:DNA-binding NarL/FixJ family response regulator
MSWRGLLRGQARAAARLFGAADALCAKADAALPVMDRAVFNRVVAAARAAMGEAAFTRAYQEGSVLTPAQMIADATKIAEGDRGGARVGTHAVSDRSSGGQTVHFTPREMTVLRLLVEGQQDADIARELGLSPRTISDNVRAMTKKCGLRNRTALAVYAVRRGLVEEWHVNPVILRD